MAKKIIGKLKLQVKAGQANPSPPVGPALGQRGLNIMEFCKQFNAKTADLEPGSPRLRSIITYYQDKSFTPGAQDAAGVVPPEEGGRAEAGGQAEPPQGLHRVRAATSRAP